MRRVHLDANVILRFLRNDDRKQSSQAAALFRHAKASEEFELIVSAMTLMEVFYVLTRAYGFPRADASAALSEFLYTGAVTCPNFEAVLGALSHITSQKHSFGDAYLAVSAKLDEGEIASFDRGMASIEGVRLYPL